MSQLPAQNKRATFGKQMLKEIDKLDRETEKQAFFWPKILMNRTQTSKGIITGTSKSTAANKGIAIRYTGLKFNVHLHMKQSFQ